MPALTVPLAAAKFDAWEGWVAELTGPRKAAFDDMNARHGLTEHRAYLQPTPDGNYVVLVVAEGSGAESFVPSIMQSDHEFDQWFGKNVAELHDMDLSQPMPPMAARRIRPEPGRIAAPRTREAAMQDLRRDAPYEAGATALLFVDMQTIWAVPGLDPHHPEWPADHPFYTQLRTVTIPNQVRLLEAARGAGIEVIHTIIECLTLDGRDRSPDYVMSGLFVPRGLPEGRVIDELAPNENEIVIPKTSSGVFNSTNIEYVLRNLGVRYLIVAGTVTDQCVDMAVRDAADRGFLVTCVSDACATYTQERHEGALKAFGGYCWVADTDTVVGRLAAIAAPAAV